MPFEGQTSQNVGTAKASNTNRSTQTSSESATIETVQPSIRTGQPVKSMIPVERKKFTQPGVKIVTKNIGIKSILDPPKNQQIDNQDALLTDIAEPFTHTELMAVWASFALNLKRERKDSLYATLTGSEPLLNSNNQITLEIANSAQASELEREKINLLSHLRSNLKNYQISFVHKISEKKQSFSTDTKSTFEKLAEDNPSLIKFKRLFNLDLDF